MADINQMTSMDTKLATVEVDYYILFIYLFIFIWFEWILSVISNFFK